MLKILNFFGVGRNIFVLTNLLFSFSTYIVTYLLSYYFTQKLMAEFTSVYNVFLILLPILELGISVSFLRYKEMYQLSSRIVFSFWQIFLYILLIVLAFSRYGDFVLSLFFDISLEDFNISLLYFSLVGQFSWLFSKTWILQNSNFKIGAFQALFILMFRVFVIIYFFLHKEVINLENVFLYLFCFPFIISFIYSIFKIISLVKKIKIMDLHLYLYKNRIKNIITFSIFTYIISSLYILTTRYSITYLSNTKLTVNLADMGYSFIFVGIISLFVSTLRTYYISKFNIGDMLSINIYIKKIEKYLYMYILFVMFISFLLMIIVYFLKPIYVTVDACFYIGIISFSYGIIAYFSMITLLGKTFKMNKEELIINLIRLIGVYIIVNVFFPVNVIFGLVLVYILIIYCEYIFSLLIKRQINNKVNR